MNESRSLELTHRPPVTLAGARKYGHGLASPNIPDFIDYKDCKDSTQTCHYDIRISGAKQALGDSVPNFYTSLHFTAFTAFFSLMFFLCFLPRRCSSHNTAPTTHISQSSQRRASPRCSSKHSDFLDCSDMQGLLGTVGGFQGCAGCQFSPSLSSGVSAQHCSSPQCAHVDVATR